LRERRWRGGVCRGRVFGWWWVVVVGGERIGWVE
jgi:hypothetical protein